MSNSNESRDMNRDPITGEAGSHPVGTGVGALGGAAAGAVVGSIFGPIGTLIGGAIGAAGGGAAGHNVAESIDPTGEAEYWKSEYQSRPYFNKQYDYESDYSPAYAYGNQVRSEYANRKWDSSLESDIKQGWEKAKAKSRLTWEEAKDAVRDAFDRSDRTYRTYEATDRYYKNEYANSDYAKGDYSYENDYRPAYRYGTQARSMNTDAKWDDKLEANLEQGWNRTKGASRLAWQDAKGAVKDAWHGVERALPGDADNDGR
ncbi:glycine zipper domain-containing protein [Lysobacter soyae]|jgi:hypothetical protein|uniref:Glycine zipper domain-containing protein n=1 Tax=Lysobacter soyae TaxID=2764185 RepID=A0ABX8WR08_9GAMM|nr:glycine zipper domain-containing protein [Lysobacter sp. CJ11]QYR53268.1 hypothetical protein H8L67_01755 [Lysobacter sp. CJ11]